MRYQSHNMAIIRIFSFYISILVSTYSILFSRKFSIFGIWFEALYFQKCIGRREVYRLLLNIRRRARTCVHRTPMKRGMLYTFLQPAFLYRIIARLALHPCRVTHMPYRPVKKLRRAIDDPEQPTLSP